MLGMLRSQEVSPLTRDLIRFSLFAGKATTLEETPFETARREAYEEIGLPQDDTEPESRFKIEPLCQLPVSLAYTELGVRPCVAFASPIDNAATDAETSFMPKLNPKEVTAIFTAPFRNFLRSRNPDDIAQGTSNWYKPVLPGVWGDERWPMHQFFVAAERSSRSRVQQQRYRVFGLTARILVDAARVAYAEDPDFMFNERIGEEDVIAAMIQSGRMSRPRKPGDAFSMKDMAEAIRPKI